MNNNKILDNWVKFQKILFLSKEFALQSASTTVEYRKNCKKICVSRVTSQVAINKGM